MGSADHYYISYRPQLRATSVTPQNTYYAASTPAMLFTVPNGSNNPDPPRFRNFNAGMLPNQGGSQPHDNMQPYLAITYIISLFGVYPSPN